MAFKVEIITSKVRTYRPFIGTSHKKAGLNHKIASMDVYPPKKPHLLEAFKIIDKANKTFKALLKGTKNIPSII